MIPLLTTNDMRAADADAARRRGDPGALVEAAGLAVALEARRMLNGCYGRRVIVLVGPGLNGEDGRVAARHLRSRGAHVDLVSVASQPAVLPPADLLIDAAFGLGCSRPYHAPRIAVGTPVLAVDLPSGVDADSGELLGSPLRATVTLALGALKPAHLLAPARDVVGELRFAGLGILEHARDGVVEDADLRDFVRRDADDHKWTHALAVLAGSTLMPGAAALVCGGALAGGASMIRLQSRGDVAARTRIPPEVVLEAEGPLDARCLAVVAGPGLGPDAPEWIAQRLRHRRVPLVLDADGLAPSLVQTAGADAPVVLTPHDGEFQRLTGTAPGADRLAAARSLARDTNCVVLLKGPTTVLAAPDGTLRVVTSGTDRLATAGSGDVLSGTIGASLARGLTPLHAAALSAHLHGRASQRVDGYLAASALPRLMRATLRDVTLGRL